ncbi:isoleucine--tRNA ligase [Nanoarchaeota archaeon]
MDKIENYDFKAVEESVLEFWSENKIHEKANEKNKGKERYYFLDGPPYTSGKVHIGTAWNKSLKDCVLRFKRMKGLDVWDRAGYDMHGLPTAHAVEKKLGINGKEEILKFGVDKFIQECKDLSINNMKVMNQDFTRLGVWMDFENAYQTMSDEYIEGEWWLIKKAHENKRLYEGKRTMTWCADCGTALAKHELEYQQVTEPSIYLKFPVVGSEKEFLIVWTTTPWTIPYNMAVMVNPNLDYVKAKVGDETWIVAKALTAFIPATAGQKFEVIEEFKGDKLEGIKYKHPLEEQISYFKEVDSDKLHTVLLSEEYVDTSAGSGLVHCAPGCGPEDYEVGHKNGLPPFNELDEHGVFKESMGKFAGIVAKKDDQKIIDLLDESGSLIATSPVEHDYAHCWRCKHPVIFRTTTQWFFKIEDLKETMRELNKSINWVPDYAGSRQFDSWLDNLRDNSITRQRFWGTPLPIWRCECGEYDVIGSIKELEEKSGQKPKDIHKPFIDEISWKCKCGKDMKRIPDILDVWVDAGVAAWTCLDYPQKTELFEKMFPADFIMEGIDQIRGWFNLLFVASMISLKKPSYKAVYMHGFINDAQGRKMSKSLQNYILPEEVVDKYGADTFRFYSIGGTNPGQDLNYNFDDMKVKHRNLIVLWNLHKFLAEYSGLIGKNPKEIQPKLEIEEKYILSKLNSTIKKVTELFETYKLNEVPLAVEELFLELSRTYVQLVREKSSTGSDEDKETVLYTLYHVLMGCLKMLTPIVPMVTEQMYLNLKERFGLEEESIHLTDWPKVTENLIDSKLEENIEIAKSVIQGVLSGREKAKLGVRWPISEAIVVSEKEEVRMAAEGLSHMIKTQGNVKEVKAQEDFVGVHKTMKPDYAKLNPEFKEDSPSIIAQISTQSLESISDHLEKEGVFVITANGKKFELKKEHFIEETTVNPPFVMAEAKGIDVYINTELTPELEGEGYSRELMRRVQAFRKKEGLEKKDNIELFISGDTDMIKEHADVIKEKVGASSIEFTGKGSKSEKVKIKDKEFEVSFNLK